MAFSKNHKFHMGIKLHEHDKFNTPGAGAYNPDFHKIKGSAPNFSMKQKLNNSAIDNTPGPGNYESHLNDKRNAPKFGFGSSTRAAANKNDSPGPGHYKINTKVAETAQYAIPGKDQTFKYV